MSDVQSSPPSRNPSDNDSLIGLLRLFETKMRQRWDDMLPAQVIAYDRDNNLVQVQPLILMVTTDNIQVKRAQVSAIPALQLGGGGFVLSFPLRENDLGWIKANDRDISLFLQTWEQSPPNTQRSHNFSDAVFIPDTMLRSVAIADEDTANAVFQSEDGTVKIALWSDLIKILAPAGVGIGGTPTANTQFDVQSITMASIPWPRMSVAERNAIPNPQDGMAVWITDPTTHRLSTWSAQTSAWS